MKEPKQWKVGIDIVDILVHFFVPPTLIFNFRSNTPIKKQTFLFERYDIRDLYFILCIHLSVRFSAHLSIDGVSQLSMVLTVQFKKKYIFCLKGTAYQRPIS